MKSLLTFLILSAAFLSAQNVRVDGVVQSRSGAPAPGASLAVCSQPANTSIVPCSPLAPLCASIADGICAALNPVTTDGLGNYFFYIAPGLYTYQFYGSGLTSRVLPDQALGLGGGGATPGTPAVAVSPPAINFGTVQNNTTSLPQVVTISNTGTQAAVINSASFATGTRFSSTNLGACNVQLLAGAGCSLLIMYTPTTGVTDTDTLTFTSNAPINPLNPLTVALGGTGTASASFPLTVNCAPGTGSGTIVSNEAPPLINAVCTKGSISGVFSNNYASGATPILTAASTDGGTPGNFSGGGCSSNPCTVTVSAATTVSETFTALIPNFQLAISPIDQGIGTVTSDLVDVLTGLNLNCTSTSGVLTGNAGHACNITLNQGSTPILTETPSGSCTGGACTFKGWEGIAGCDPTGATSTCPIPALNSNVTASVDFAQPAGNGPLTLVQKGTTSTASGAIKGTFGATQKAGDLNVCGAWWNDATTTVSGVTDTAGNPYTQVSAGKQAANGQSAVMYYSCNIAAAASGNVVTFALNATPTSRQTHCAEYSGILASCADGSVGATGTSTSVASGPLTTTANGDLLVGTDVVAGSITAPSSGWIQDILDSGFNDFEHIQVGVAGAYPFAPTQSPSGFFGAIMAAFKTGGTAPATFSVQLVCAGPGNGTATSPSGLSITCNNGSPSGSPQSVAVNAGSTIAVNANPLAGSAFGGFSGGGCGSSPSCVTQAITTNTVITVTFNLSGTQQFYIATTGNDSNAGTLASPWLTFNHANSALTLGGSGTTVNVAAGTYNQCPILNRVGTANQPIKYVGASSYGSVIVCGSSGSFSSGVSLPPSSAWTTFTGFDVSGSLLCEGIVVEGVNNTASGNYVHAVGAPATTCGGGGGGGAGILIGAGTATGCTNASVIGNIVDNIGPFPTASNFVHGIYAAACNGNIYNNICSRTVGWCIQVNHSSVSSAFIYNVSNNVTMNTAKGGILIEDGNNHSVYNNIVVQTPTEHGIEENYGSTGANNTYRNNLIVQAVPTPWFFENGPRTSTGNLCDVIQTPECPAAITPTQATLSNIFVNYTGNAKTGDYHLKAGSVGINAGVNGVCIPSGPCVPSIDFAGNPRPQGTNWDIGAYEQ